MLEETLEPLHAQAQAPSAGPADPLGLLRSLLIGAAAPTLDLPPLPDVAAAAAALAQGTRRKVLLPLGRVAVELALCRRGPQVIVDCYGTETTPQVLVRERAVALPELLDACARSSRELARLHGEGPTGVALLQLAARLVETRVIADPEPAEQRVRCTGGSLQSPGAQVPLAFGFEAQVPRAHGERDEPHGFADVHALLFQGELWAFSGERRVSLVRGPIMLVAMRMVAAMRALVDAWQAGRPMHVRLCTSGFTIAVRRQGHGGVSLAMTTERHGTLTWPALDVPTAALPVLRLASDLVRKLVAVDRAQSHNLRVHALRGEVRALRRLIRGHGQRRSFENPDPERLRLPPAEPAAALAAAAPVPMRSPGKLRYTERWSAEIDALDAGSLFLCGDRLIVATPKLTMALHGGNGEVLWSLPSERATTVLCGTALLRLLTDGGAELLDAREGRLYARADRGLRLHGAQAPLFAGGGELPPIALLREAGKHLLALDLRTGEPRWRLRSRGQGAPRMLRAGRVLLVASGDGSLDALDVASGELVWRLAEAVRFCLAPAVVDDVVVAVAGEPGGGAGTLFGVELYTGRPLWKTELPLAPSAEPLCARGLALLPIGGSRDARLLAFEPATGAQCWSAHDPGLDNGGRALSVDGALIVNTAAGRLTSLDLRDGSTRYSRALANPLTDDVPRQLTPVLRHGALFVPSAQVHVLRPEDGSPVTSGPICDLVPDFLRVDERGHVFVAEESGHLRAYAAAPQLQLVRS